MGRSKFIPVFKTNNLMRLFWEKNLLSKNYDFLKTRIIGNTLYCTGTCTPSEYSIEYKYKIMYSQNCSPAVYIINPKIAYTKEIHMYPRDNRLCLYYPKDFSWTSSSHLYNTIIPWTHEWIVFYELYLIKGEWLYPAVSHEGEKK